MSTGLPITAAGRGSSLSLPNTPGQVLDADAAEDDDRRARQQGVRGDFPIQRGTVRPGISRSSTIASGGISASCSIASRASLTVTTRYPWSSRATCK